MGIFNTPDQRVIGTAAGSMPTQAAERSTRGSPAEHRRISGEGSRRERITQIEAWLAGLHRRTRATAGRPYETAPTLSTSSGHYNCSRGVLILVGPLLVKSSVRPLQYVLP
ncbi:MAG: hypothetical protein JXB07_15960 [Anaerolineae bacterium]|nr:hypothetical protein [Anaerolineae bacterium]